MPTSFVSNPMHPGPRGLGHADIRLNRSENELFGAFRALRCSGTGNAGRCSCNPRFPLRVSDIRLTRLENDRVGVFNEEVTPILQGAGVGGYLIHVGAVVGEVSREVHVSTS